MYLFIDANIYLGFLRASNTKLQALSQLRLLLKAGEVKLIFPRITQDEFVRNYPTVASECIEMTYKRKIRTLEKYPPQLPTILRGKKKQSRPALEHAKNLMEALRDEEIVYRDAVEKFIEDILGLDSVAEDVDDQEEHVERAISRRYRGNPPGKGNGALGDEIAWELLLDNCTKERLVVVSADGDWRDIFQETIVPRPLLLREWKAVSKHSFKLFGTLGDFIASITAKGTIPKEEISEERVAVQEVEQLLTSSASLYPYSTQGFTTVSTVSGLPGTTTTYTATPMTAVANFTVPSVTAQYYMGKKCYKCGNPLDPYTASNICNSCLINPGLF